MEKNIQNMSVKNTTNYATRKVSVAFSSINQIVETNVKKPIEKDNGEFVYWGEANLYPVYLYSLYQESPTLQAIINGVVDYTAGNGMEDDDVEMENLVRQMALSYAIYGGFALSISRNRFGGIAKVTVLDMRYVRSNRENTQFFYSEAFARKWGRSQMIKLPKFDPEDKQQWESIYYVKTSNYSTVYPIPMYSAAVNSAECEKLISDFHLNSIHNGFSSNVMVSINGFPTDEEKSQIEDAFNEKFTGSENAARPILVFSQDKEHAPEIMKLDTDSFADRYSTLSKKIQFDLFTAFRCNPNLMGIPTEGTGFSGEEYENTFKLFNRFTIKPIQKLIINALSNIYENKEIAIKPFSMD